MAWAPAEAEMALLLGQLLGAENAATLAVFQALRRSSAQRDAISEAGRVCLNKVDLELLTAILNVHKSIESERNALAHGHFGVYSHLPDGILWMTTNDYIAFKVHLTLSVAPNVRDDKIDTLNRNIFYYKDNDLILLFDEIDDLAYVWQELIKYLQLAKVDAAQSAQLYRQLCDRPRIVQELERLRREKNPPTPP